MTVNIFNRRSKKVSDFETEIDSKIGELDAAGSELEAVSKIRRPIRLKIFLVKRYHRKILYELFLKSLGQIPRLQEPDQEWIERRMRGSSRSWEVWDQ